MPNKIIVDTKFIRRVENINFQNFDLRRDIRDGSIDDCYIKKAGYVGNRPSDCKDEFHEDDTWAIDVYTKDNFVVTSYLYVSEFEYNKDLKFIENASI